MAMRRFELDDLVNRPGTYFNPQTEVLVVVDDSPELDAEIFDMENAEGADWVLVSEESPIEEHVRDELLERFQARHAPTGDATLLETEEEEEFDGFEVQDPDEEL
jgi:phosphoribosylamine-glycine ligase